MRTSVLRRQSNRLRKHSDLRALAAAASRPMDAPESPPACNFPEILARDLEVSEATFLARSMTAGTPIRSLARLAPERQKQPLYVSLDDHNPRVHWKDALANDCSLGVIEETSYHSDSSDNGTTPSEVASLTSDSSTDSGPEMEPPSVRMLQQSVCTNATSGITHCLPTKEQPDYSLVALEESYQGQSWIDLDMEDSDDEDDEPEEAQTALAGRAPKQGSECAVNLQRDALHVCPASPGHGRDPEGNGASPAHPPSLDRVLATLPPSSFSSDRPHTSSGVSVQEKPLLTEGSRSHLVHKRSSSSQNALKATSTSLLEVQRRLVHSWDSAATTLASQASGFQHEILSSETTANSTDPKLRRYQARMPTKSTGISPQRVPSRNDVGAVEERWRDEIGDCNSRDNDQSVVDLSNDSSIGANERLSRVHPNHVVEEISQDPGHPPIHPQDLIAAQAEQAPQDPPTPAESSNSSESSVVETFFRSKIALPNACVSSSRAVPGDEPTSPSDKAPVNMRLHPDVFHRLEASVKGFPDTMLSTRALPIDIIRSLPRNRSYSSSSTSPASLSLALSQPDVLPYPPAGSRWNLSLRKRGDNHYHQPQTPPPPPPPPPTSTSPSQPTNPTLASTIQRVFPSGNALHCDSLYAHLVAYNYITSVCGPDAFYSSDDSSCMSPAAPRLPAATMRKTRNLMHRLTDREEGVAIPRKASMLLGMDKAAPPRATGKGGATSNTNTNTHAKASRVRSLFTGRGKGSNDGLEGRMVPAKNGVSGRPRPVTERDVKDVQVGLLRCIRSLVFKLKTGRDRRGGEDEVGRLREDDFEVDEEGWRGMDPYLLRALVEIVKGEEERLVGVAAA